MNRVRLTAAFAVALLVAMIAIAQANSNAYAAPVVPASEPRCVSAAVQSTAVHRAGLVVTFGDRHSELFCIAFTEDTISGLELLRRSGLGLITSGMGGLGGAVCRIEDGNGVGDGSSDPSNCLLPCSGGTCLYWAYYQYTNGAWRYAQIGASQRTIHDGDIDGWAWGSGGVSSGAAPAAPGDICPSPTQTPAPTATLAPSSTPEPAPSIAPATTATPDPEDTAVAPATKTRAAGTPTLVSEPTVAPPGAVDAVDGTPVSDVEAGVHAPDAAPTQGGDAVDGAAVTVPISTATNTPAATSTPRAGVAVVAADVGKQNAARSERATTSRSGGGATALWTFGAVATALTAFGAFALYRRRRMGRAW